MWAEINMDQLIQRCDAISVAQQLKLVKLMYLVFLISLICIISLTPTSKRFSVSDTPYDEIATIGRRAFASVVLQPCDPPPKPVQLVGSTCVGGRSCWASQQPACAAAPAGGVSAAAAWVSCERRSTARTPSANPCTTSARSQPSAPRAVATSTQRRGSNTPHTCRAAPAGSVRATRA